MDIIKKKFPKTLTTNWRFQHQANKDSGKITGKCFNRPREIGTPTFKSSLKWSKMVSES